MSALQRAALALKTWWVLLLLRLGGVQPTAVLVVTTKAERGHKNHDDLVLDAHDLAGGGAGKFNIDANLKAYGARRYLPELR